MKQIALTEEQEMLRASARDFLQKECGERLVQDAQASSAGYSPELWSKIAGLGWLGLAFPEKYNGSGMGLVDLAVLCEELGRAAFPGPFVSTVASGGLSILEFGTEKQRSTILPALAAGKEIFALALSQCTGHSSIEPEAGSVTIDAVRDGDSFVLSGRALLVPDAGIATRFLVPAQTHLSEGPGAGVMLFVVSAGHPRITVTRLAGLGGDIAWEITFDGVRVASDGLVGPIDSGPAVMERMKQAVIVMRSAQMLGSGERLLQVTTDDYDARVKANESARDAGTVRFLDLLRTSLSSGRLAIYEAAQALADGDSGDFEKMIFDSWKDYEAFQPR